MTSFGDLSLQAHGVITCEKNSKLLSTEPNLVSDYQKITLSNYGQKRKNLAAYEMADKPIFLKNEEALYLRLLKSWEKHGFTGVLDTIANHEEVPTALISVSERLRSMINVLSSMQERVFAKQVQETASKRNFFMACHPSTSKIAIAQREVHEIRVVDVHTTGCNEFILKDKRLNTISCLSWRPMSALSLAVGCKSGILVWFIDGDHMKKGSSNTARLFVPDEIKSDVMSLSWCKNGLLLAASYEKSPSFIVWNVLTHQYTVIERAGSPISFLMWSQCGQRLFAPTDSTVFRVWETHTWSCDKWTDLNGKCTHACWSSDGTVLLFTVENDSCIYAINFFKKRASFSSSEIDTSSSARKCIDLSSIDTMATGESLGSLVTNMVWDPTNSRLAVTFSHERNDSNQRGVALFHTKIHPLVQIIPCGFIQGEENETPICIDFNQSFEKGAQLVIYWSSNSISSIPCYFNKDLTYQASNVTMATINVGSTLFYDTIHNTSVSETSLSH